MDRILLIDGLNFIYKSSIKFGDTSLPYNTIYIFFRSLRALIEQFNPNRCFFILEGKNNFRYKLYPQYKANRVKLASTIIDNNINFQRDIIIDLLKYLPIHLVKADTYEGDDVIYTLVNDLRDEDVIIVSSDSDYIQVLQEFAKYSIKLYNPIYKSFIEKPDYVYLVWKSIAGDNSDNIKSIKSKEEAELIANSPKLLREFLAIDEQRAEFNLNRDLIQLRLIDSSQLEFVYGNANFDYLKQEFEKMSFASMFKNNYWEKFQKTFTSLK